MKSRSILKIIFCFIIGISTISGINAQFVHPGLANNKAELDKIKADVIAGVQPRKGGYDLMMSNSLASLSYSNSARAVAQADGGNSSNFATDALAAYTHALAWYINGNQAHANKSIEIMNAWSNVLTDIVTAGGDSKQYILVTGWVGEMFCEAAEIIRYSNAGWAAGDITKFENMMKNVFYPHANVTASGYNGNWEASQINTIIAIGVFCNDQAIYNQAVGMISGTGRGAIGVYCYTSGEVQETCRDQHHTMMGLGELVDACEIAWKQGLDLFSQLPVNSMPRLAQSLEYTAKIVNGICMPSSCGLKCEATSIGNEPMWEKAWNHFGNRMNRTDMPTVKLLAEKGRPTGKSGLGMFAWQTLTHSNMNINSTPPIPDPIAPTAPSTLASSNISDISFTLTWTAGTDNIGVTGYDVYIGGVYKTTLSGTTGTVNGLTPFTTYEVTLVTKDAAGNASPASSPISVTTLAGCGSAVPWTNSAVAAQTGTFTAEFDAIPRGVLMDGAFGLSKTSATTYNDFACAVRFYTNGKIEARNAGAYESLNELLYLQNTSYHIRMVVNVITHKYDIYATPSGGAEVTIGTAYSFRPEQATVTQLANFAYTSMSCGLTVSGFSITTSTGLAGSNSYETISVYPNPLNKNGYLTIDFGVKLEKAIIEISDISAKVIFRNFINGESQVKIKSNIQSGMYFIRINDNKNNSYNQKLIVE